MQIYNVLRVARQQYGEYVLVTVLSSWKNQTAAEDALREAASTYSKPVIIQTDAGPVNCLCEVGVFTSNLED